MGLTVLDLSDEDHQSEVDDCRLWCIQSLGRHLGMEDTQVEVASPDMESMLLSNTLCYSWSTAE